MTIYYRGMNINNPIPFKAKAYHNTASNNHEGRNK